MKENKENQITLFNNSFIREKQRTFRINSVNLKNCNLYLNYNIENDNEIKYGYKIVNNDIKLFKAFLAKTRSSRNYFLRLVLKHSIKNFLVKNRHNGLLFC